MGGWMETMSLLEGVGRTLQHDPTDFEELSIAQEQIRRLLERRGTHGVYIGVLFFLERYLAYIQEAFPLDCFMDAGGALAVRSEALKTIGKKLERSMRVLQRDFSAYEVCVVLSVLTDALLDAVDLINGKAAEEAAASFQSGRVLDANP